MIVIRVGVAAAVAGARFNPAGVAQQACMATTTLGARPLVAIAEVWRLTRTSPKTASLIRVGERWLARVRSNRPRLTPAVSNLKTYTMIISAVDKYQLQGLVVGHKLGLLAAGPWGPAGCWDCVTVS